MKHLLVTILSLSISGCVTTTGAVHSETPQESHAESKSGSWVWWALGGAAIAAALLAGGSDDASPPTQNNDPPDSGNFLRTCVSTTCIEPP
jgi:hypothetical protein